MTRNNTLNSYKTIYSTPEYEIGEGQCVYRSGECVWDRRHCHRPLLCPSTYYQTINPEYVKENQDEGWIQRWNLYRGGGTAMSYPSLVLSVQGVFYDSQRFMGHVRCRKQLEGSLVKTGRCSWMADKLMYKRVDLKQNETRKQVGLPQSRSAAHDTGQTFQPPCKISTCLARFYP